MGCRKKKKKGRKSRKQRAREPGEGSDFRYHTVFVGGKQKRIREALIDGIPVDEWEQQNADPIYLKQNEMWEVLDELHERENSESEHYTDPAGTVLREPGNEDAPPSAVDGHSPPSAKIELFRSLFRE